MALDVDAPEPPSLSGPQDPGEYDAVDEQEEWTGDESTREALAELLHEGAWEDAFGEWSDGTYLTEEQFRAVEDVGLFSAFDFYWNQGDEDVGYRAPSLPADLPEPYDDELDRGDRQDVEEELDSLGRTVSEVLESDYIHRDAAEFGFFPDE